MLFLKLPNYTLLPITVYTQSPWLHFQASTLYDVSPICAEEGDEKSAWFTLFVHTPIYTYMYKHGYHRILWR